MFELGGWEKHKVVKDRMQVRGMAGVLLYAEIRWLLWDNYMIWNLFITLVAKEQLLKLVCLPEGYWKIIKPLKYKG